MGKLIKNTKKLNEKKNEKRKKSDGKNEVEKGKKNE